MAEVRTSDNGLPRLVVDPMENVLVGSGNILRYLGIDSIVTLYTWVELYGCPCIKRPDGRWMTTMTAIDQWIWLGAEADLINRIKEGKSRGSALSREAAVKRARHIFGEDSPQAELMTNTINRTHDGNETEGKYSKKSYPRATKLSEGRRSRAGVGGSGAFRSE